MASEAMPPLSPSDVPALSATLARALGVSNEGISGTSVDALGAVCSSRADAERTLEMLESRAGFASCLAEIIVAGGQERERRAMACESGTGRMGGAGCGFGDACTSTSGSAGAGGGGDAADAVPWLASVHLKNVCVRRWRRDGLNDDEKSFVRRRLVEILIREYNDSIAVQVQTRMIR